MFVLLSANVKARHGGVSAAAQGTYIRAGSSYVALARPANGQQD